MSDKTREIVQRAICESKNKYGSKKYAKKAAKVMKRKGRMFKVYECPWCGDWHLTSKAKRKD